MSVILNNTIRAAFVAVAIAGCAPVYDNATTIPTETRIRTAVEAEAGNDYQTASLQYQTLLDLQPDNRHYLLGWARNLRYVGQAKFAIEAMKRKFGVHGGDATFLIELGKAEIAASQAKAAVEHLKSAIEKGGDNWEAYNALGIGFDLLQSFEEAGDAYQKASKLSPGNAQVLNNQAISAALSGKLDRAISILENAPLAARRSSQIRQNLAFFYGLKGDLTKAGILAKLDLEDDEVRNNLAVFNRFFTKPASKP